MPPLLLIFLKAPRQGAVKTRLAESLGAEHATDIYRGLVERQLRSIPPGWNVEIHFSPADAEPEMRAWLGPAHEFRPQTEGDLGARMQQAFDAAFARQAEPVIAIGGDCPTLDASTLIEAASRLTRADVVLGPAQDGGYYLIGLGRPAPQLFDDVPWSTAKVFALTLARARAHGLSREVLMPQPNVDDLPSYRRFLDAVARESSGDRLAIVIPTWNEAARITPALRAARHCFPLASTIVVDAHSADQTRELAAREKARVLIAAPGRGGQCRAGAAAARDADWLLFLRTDTLLPSNADEAVEGFMRQPKAQIATFRLRFDHPSWFLRACGWLTRFDTVFTRFGDQGILVRREFYDALGGFPDWPLFEDVALLRRARAVARVHSLPAAVTTSARRFQRTGIYRQQWLNARLLLRFLTGASPALLAAEYRAGSIGSVATAKTSIQPASESL